MVADEPLDPAVGGVHAAWGELHLDPMAAQDLVEASQLEWHAGPVAIGLAHVRACVGEYQEAWDSLKELVINGASTAELKNEAIRLGMQTLRMAGIAKLKSGMTSIEEVVGNTAPDTTR